MSEHVQSVFLLNIQANNQRHVRVKYNFLIKRVLKYLYDIL